MTVPEKPGKSSRPTAIALRWLPLGIIALVMVLVFATGWHRSVSFEALVLHQQRIAAFIAEHRVEALGIYVAIYMSVVALSIPGALIMTLSGGFLFGPLAGGAAAVVGATLGSTVLFLAARSSLGAALRDAARGSVARLADGFRDNAIAFMLFLRLAPVFPFALVNLAAAIFGIPLLVFVLTTLIGIVPATFAFALAGSSLGQLIDGQREAFLACIDAGRTDCRITLDLTALMSRNMLIALAALGCAALLPIVARKVFRRAAGKA